MTTELIKGLTREQAVEAIRQKAIEHSEACNGIGFWVESGNKEVLVGLARPGHAAVVMEFDKAEFDGMEFLQRIGIDMTPTEQSPMQRAAMHNRRMALKRAKEPR